MDRICNWMKAIGKTGHDGAKSCKLMCNVLRIHDWFHNWFLIFGQILILKMKYFASMTIIYSNI